MGKGSKRTKGTKVTLGDFIGSDPSGVNTINVGGKAVDMPSAPRASTLEIDITMVNLILIWQLKILNKPFSSRRVHHTRRSLPI